MRVIADGALHLECWLHSLPHKAFGSSRLSQVTSQASEGIRGCSFSSRSRQQGLKRHLRDHAHTNRAVDLAAGAMSTACRSIEEYRQRMTLSSSQMQQIVAEFEEQMRIGLQEESSNLLMIPTMVDVIPDGHETGTLLGIEFGGSKLRVVYTRLSEEAHGVESVQVEETLIPEDKRHCHSTELFDYIVRRMLDFATGIGRDLRAIDHVVVGLCFSFPVQNESIRSGKLIKWTKGFENEGAVGQDPVKLLTEAFKRQGVTANVGALVNDTVGTLCATRYTSGPDANIAVIMGTGTNACYVEQTRNISKWKPKYLPRTPEMVVNIEWPGFHSEVLPQLEEDIELDRESSRPGDQGFEKLTAGLYLGDTARRIIHRVAQREDWFGSAASHLSLPERFNTVQLARIAQDDSPDLQVTASTLAEVVELGDHHQIAPEIREPVKEICMLVTKRSTQLTAAAIVGILHHIERTQSHSGSGPVPRNIIAVDGGIFTQYQLYRNLVCEGVRQVSGDEFADNFELKLTEGGAGFGAAALAAAGYNYDRVMGRSQDKAPPRKFPPRGRSHSDLLSLK